jgi:AmmeMemoRadiSam system protein A
MPSLSEADRCSLLQLARHAVVEAVVHERLPEKIPVDGIFAERRGVFVTLHVNSRLRGCIGVVEPDEPLGEALVRCAASAAKSDPRFPPMQPPDLAGLQLEISLLSPIAPIGEDAIEIGRHGLLIRSGERRGILLPQVATEHRLDREQFLAETCKKAGLARDAWREQQTQIFGFTCEVIAEDAAQAAQ